MLDVKKPIGYLFLIIGGVLLLYSIFDPQITRLELVGENAGVLSLNLNFSCGLSMLAFAILMLVLSYRGSLRAAVEDREKEKA